MEKWAVEEKVIKLRKEKGKGGHKRTHPLSKVHQSSWQHHDNTLESHGTKTNHEI